MKSDRRSASWSTNSFATFRPERPFQDLVLKHLRPGDIYTHDDLGDYRIFFQVRHLPPMGGKDHQPCTVLFGKRPASAARRVATARSRSSPFTKSDLNDFLAHTWLLHTCSEG